MISLKELGGANDDLRNGLARVFRERDRTGSKEVAFTAMNETALAVKAATYALPALLRLARACVAVEAAKAAYGLGGDESLGAVVDAAQAEYRAALGEFRA
jgi:hypothetical protein